QNFRLRACRFALLPNPYPQRRHIPTHSRTTPRDTGRVERGGDADGVVLDIPSEEGRGGGANTRSAAKPIQGVGVAREGGEAVRGEREVLGGEAESGHSLKAAKVGNGCLR